jgi:hypothetical protein
MTPTGKNPTQLVGTQIGAVGQSVIFQVDHLSVKDGFAFVSGRPLQPDGKRIDYTKTRYRQELADGVFADHLVALLRKSGSGWTLVTNQLGATDVPWVGWAKRYGAPREIFPAPDMLE